MTTAPFELSWRGGATERRLRRRRGDIDGLPWGSIDLAEIPAALADEARAVWTHSVFTEYASAAAFSSLTTALLECGAPVDLVAASADIVVDEMLHVELAARVTSEFGGATPLLFDLEKVSPLPTPGARALMRAAEIAVTTSCVGEALSLPALRRSYELSTAPLVRAVLERLLTDEGPHSLVGHWFFDWAGDQLSDADRASLAATAMSAIEAYAPVWQSTECEQCPPPIGLGGRDDQGRLALRQAVAKRIAKPLADHGVVVDAGRLAKVLA